MTTRNRRSVITFLTGGIAIGATVGVGSLAISQNGRVDIARGASDVAVAAGLKRQREPQVGDYWSGCKEARDAGTAPIYRDEPGYRSEMDGDNDGIACEPYRGQ